VKNKISTQKIPKDSVTFLISNQSYDIDPVDIRILADDQIILQHEFPVLDSGQLAQHNWQRFNFSLAEGNHRILISTKKGNAKLEKIITIKKSTTVTIAYWTSKNEETGKLNGVFTVDTSENMVATM
jgi:hypothetical protein